MVPTMLDIMAEAHLRKRAEDRARSFAALRMTKGAYLIVHTRG